MTIRRLRISWPAILARDCLPHCGMCGIARAAGCPAWGETSILPYSADDQSADPSDKINYVIAISIDGLKPRAIEDLGQSRTPGVSPAHARRRLHT